MSKVQDRIFTPNFLFLSIAVFAFFMAFFMVNPILPGYVQAHGGSRSLIGLLVGGASLMSLALRPFTGRLVDSWGRRPFLLLGMALLAIGAIGYDFVANLPLLWVPRLLSGAGVALFITASMTYVADIAPPKRRGEAMGYFGMWNTLGLALGPPLAIWLVASDSLGSIERPLERWLPGAGSDVGAGEFNFALAWVIACALALIGLAFLRRVREVRSPVRRAREGLRRTVGSMFDRAGVLPGAVNCLSTMNVVALNVFVPLYGVEVGVGNVGLYFTCYAAGVVAVRLLAGRLLDRYPRAYTIIPALGVAMAGTLLVGLVQEGWMLLIGGAVIGAGHGLAQPGLQALLVDRANKEKIGAATATYNVGTDIGLGGGGFLMGVILQLTNFATMFIVAGLASGVAMAILAAATLRSPAARLAPTTAP